MPPAVTRLSLAAQTSYARLLDAVATSEAGWPFEGATLVSKRIKGHVYWYAQRTVDGRKQQTYIGPENDEIRATIERWNAHKRDATARAELVAIARASGLHAVAAAEAKVLADLAFAFRIGGVLVGSYAFAVLGNSLGVHWGEEVDDVDLAQDPTIAVALASDAVAPSLPGRLDALPLFSVLDPASPATSFEVRGSRVQVDVLTPLVGRPSNRPVPIPAIGAAAMPLRFLDYLIEETQPAVVVGGSGILANVPRPGRFALHKLLVAGRRVTAARTKATKDRAQASALLQVLMNDLPGEVTLAWKALSTRGRAWTAAVRDGVAQLDPAVVEQLASVGITPRARR
jgi:hypothetical protein